jgi:hypothetical protein
MKRNDIAIEKYYCSVIKDTVQVTIKYILHLSSDERNIMHEDKRVIGDKTNSCPRSLDCGVSNSQRRDDWSKCIHPKLKG